MRKENYSGSQNSKCNGLEWNSAKGQALTPSALTGIRVAIHRHLTCAPLSRNINILQDSEFMSANKMFEAKTKLFTKENCETKTQIIHSVRRHAEIESILHGRAEHGRRLERCGEVSWVYLVFVVFSFCSPRQRGMAGAYKAVIWNKNRWHWSPLHHRKTYWTNKKNTKEALNSLSSHTRMFVCTKLQLHLIQWLRLNFTSARLIPTARHCFRLQTKLPPRI